MSEGNLNFLGQADGRKRIYQLKRKLRSNTAETRLIIPEQAKGYGTELKPKRAASSALLPRSGH